MQRPRDRRRAERQHIHRQPQREQPLLVLHAEPLLLVDHHQPEVRELHILGHQPVRADNDVHLSLAQRAQNVVDLSGGLEPRDTLDPERVVREAVLERPLVLLGQHGGGHQHRDLLAELHGLERRPHGDLGLAIPDVAAEQAIHRTRVHHVLLDLGHRRELVLGCIKRKLVLELLLPRRIRRKPYARLRIPRGPQAQHLSRQIAHRLGDLLLLVLPTRPADDRERGRAAKTADVLLHMVDLGRRHVELRGTGELKMEIFLQPLVRVLMLRESEPLGLRLLPWPLRWQHHRPLPLHLARAHRREPLEERDAVVAMHDIIARPEVQERIHRPRRTELGRFALRTGAEPPARLEAVQ